jgi:hypothetical protein
VDGGEVVETQGIRSEWGLGDRVVAQGVPNGEKEPYTVVGVRWEPVVGALYDLARPATDLGSAAATVLKGVQEKFLAKWYHGLKVM